MQSSSKVVISSWVHPEVKTLLDGTCTVVPNDTRQALAPDDLRERCRDAHGLMAFMPECVDDAFLAACPDLRVIACALNLVNRDFLARMKPGALLINTSRGALVDEVAVADALERDRFAGYAADVFSMEDWALADRPRQVSARLLDSRKTVLTPHLGSAVDRVRREIALQAAESMLQALRGEVPAGAVNRPASLRPPVLA